MHSPRLASALVPMVVGLFGSALTAQGVEVLAKYDFINESLDDNVNNPNINASSLTTNRDVMFWSGNGYSNICFGSAWSNPGGYVEFSVEPANPGDTLDLVELDINYGGHGANGDVDRMEIYADEDPGPGGDNFQTLILGSDNLDQDFDVDLSSVAFLQGISGRVTFRVQFFDTDGRGDSNHEVDHFRIDGRINTPPPGPTNPCLGPQVFFNNGWQNSSYTVNGQTPQWHFPNWSNQYDVACIGDPDPSINTHIPAIWSNSCSVGCRKLEFTIKGRAEGHDDDSIGFVLGFCDGEQNDPNADYLAVIWNGPEQTAQFPNHCEPVTKPEGLHLVRVTGIPDPAEFLGQTNLPCTPASSGVELLQEAINLGDTGWPPGVAQDIRVEVQPNSVQVWVEGSLEIDYQAPIMVNYLEECFGYYAQSQFADFWGLEIETLNPFTASWSTYGNGTPGCAGVPDIGLNQNPVLGTLARVFVGNDQAAGTTCAFFVSLTSGNMFLPILDGDLNVGFPLAGTVTLFVPPGGATFDCAVPDNSCVGGVSLFWQAICLDSCASMGLSATRGLEMTFGDF